MVRQLMAKGFDVKGLVLVDSPSPIDHQPLPDDVISYAINLSDQKVVSVFKRHDAIRNEFQSNASLLGNYEAVPLPRQTGRRSLPTVMLRSQRVLDTESLCGVRYDWLSKQNARDASIADWEGLIGGHIEVLPIPGNHFEVFSPENVRKTLCA
jgi:thioesterase domain-containing protein